jgi:hypothetical protein
MSSNAKVTTLARFFFQNGDSMGIPMGHILLLLMEGERVR